MHHVTKNGAMLLSSEPDRCTQVRYASVINTGNVTDDCLSSLSPRCSLTVLQLYIHVHENSEVQNGSDVGSQKQAPQNSLVCRWWRVEPSHNHTLISLCFFFSLLDYGWSHTTRTNRDDDRWSFCARSRQRPEVEFSFWFSTYQWYHHQSALLRLGITVAVRQVKPALLWKKRKEIFKKYLWS